MRTLLTLCIGAFCVHAVLLGNQLVDRPGFSLEYPDTWTLADTQSDYNPDRFFVIDSNGQSNVTIELFVMEPGNDPDDLLFNAISVLDGPLVDTYARSTFEEWGNLQGKGTHLKGKVMALFPGGARIFFSREGDRGIMVTEIYYAEDLPSGVAEGFKVIGNSFRFK